MGDILLIGNGFDLAHNLHTKYDDFLYLMKNWDSFNAMYQRVKREYNIGEKEDFYKYLKNASNMDDENIRLLGKIIENNSWVKYYCKCEAEIDGWIDFEREIYPVIDLFGKVIRQTDYEITINGAIRIDRKNFNANEMSIAGLWKDYFEVESLAIIVKLPYGSVQYGILKKKILKSLRESFDEFINAFEIYLYEFVYREKNVPILDQIRRINPKYVVRLAIHCKERYYPHTKK